MQLAHSGFSGCPRSVDGKSITGSHHSAPLHDFSVEVQFLIDVYDYHIDESAPGVMGRLLR